jgi:hypothetical protein
VVDNRMYFIEHHIDGVRGPGYSDGHAHCPKPVSIMVSQDVTH